MTWPNPTLTFSLFEEAVLAIIIAFNCGIMFSSAKITVSSPAAILKNPTFYMYSSYHGYKSFSKIQV